MNETIYYTVKSLLLPQTAALESIGREKLNHRRMGWAWIWGTLQLLGLMGGTILPCFPGGNGNFRDDLSPGLAAEGSFTVRPIQVDGVWACRDNPTFWAQDSPATAYTWAKMSNFQGQAGLVIIVVAVKVYKRGENKMSSVCCLCVCSVQLFTLGKVSHRVAMSVCLCGAESPWSVSGPVISPPSRHIHTHPAPHFFSLFLYLPLLKKNAVNFCPFWYWFYSPHTSRESASPVWSIFLPVMQLPRRQQ